MVEIIRLLRNTELDVSSPGCSRPGDSQHIEITAEGAHSCLVRPRNSRARRAHPGRRARGRTGAAGKIPRRSVGCN